MRFARRRPRTESLDDYFRRGGEIRRLPKGEYVPLGRHYTFRELGKGGYEEFTEKKKIRGSR